MDLVNLGFGGSALLDPFVARVIRETPADLISLKIGINLVNTDLMRLRAFVPAVHGFLDSIREGHPDTPLLVISPIACPMHEATPGPSEMDLGGLADGRLSFVAAGDPAEIARGKLTLRVIREELARIVEERAADDPHLGSGGGRTAHLSLVRASARRPCAEASAASRDDEQTPQAGRGARRRVPISDAFGAWPCGGHDAAPSSRETERAAVAQRASPRRRRAATRRWTRPGRSRRPRRRAGR